MPTEIRISASVSPISSRNSRATPESVIEADVRSAFWRPQTDRQLHDLEIVQQRERFLAPCDLESEGRARRRIEGPHRSIHNLMRIEPPRPAKTSSWILEALVSCATISPSGI